MKSFSWSNKLLSRGRSPRLFYLSSEGWKEFTGDAIPGILAVTAASFERAGKWSGTDYELCASDSAIVAGWTEPFEGYGQTWQSIAKSIKIFVGTIPDKIGMAKAIPEKFFNIRELDCLRNLSRLGTAVVAAESNEAALASLETPAEGERSGVIINATPHPVQIVGQDGKVIRTFPKGEFSIRLTASTEAKGTVDGVPITFTLYGKPIGLPEQQEGHFYIVSQLVQSALPERRDLLVPAELVRDPSGNITGCRSLGR